MTYNPDFHNALSSGWCVAPLNERERIRVTGDDRATFLQNFCTNDVVGCKPGEGCEVFFTNVQGKILAHAFVLIHTDYLILDIAAGQAESLIPHLDRYLIMESVELEDVSDQFDHLVLCGAEVVDALQRDGIEVPSDVLHHVSVTVAETDCLLTSVAWTQGALVVTCPRGQRDQLLGFFASRGAVVGSEEDFSILRIANRMPVYGRDITEANLPQEVDRNDSAINFNKGCYLGQETVARIDALGHVNWLLRSVEVLQPAQVVDNDVKLDGKVAARIQSQVETPDGVLALAYVRANLAEKGTLVGDALRVMG